MVQSKVFEELSSLSEVKDKMLDQKRPDQTELMMVQLREMNKTLKQIYAKVMGDEAEDGRVTVVSRVLQAMSDNRPYTAYILWEKIKETAPDAKLSTITTTLNQLEKKGKLERVVSGTYRIVKGQ